MPMTAVPIGFPPQTIVMRARLALCRRWTACLSVLFFLPGSEHRVNPRVVDASWLALRALETPHHLSGVTKSRSHSTAS